MFFNSRFVRVLVGLLLLGVAVFTFLPALTGYTSLDGTVNAHFAVLAAPIDGTIQNTPPKVGTALKDGGPLLSIRNVRVNRAIAGSLSAELEATRERLTALDIQRRQLGRLRNDLAERHDAFLRASVRSIEQEVAVAHQRIGINEAQQVASNSELRRRVSLGASGIVAGSQVEAARAAQATSTGEGRVALAEMEGFNRQLEAVGRGVFVGDGRNDVPYSRQRQDEVTIQLTDVDVRLRENEARVHQIEKQLQEEQDRIKRLEFAESRMPFDCVIWRNNVVIGTNVVVGSELQRILDCRDLFIDILVSEADHDEIYPGRSAEIRLLGRSEVLEGDVVSVRGSAAAVEETTLAATPPQSRGKNAQIRVALAPSLINTDFPNFCQVGRTAQVRFESRTFPLKRWLNALWFSIT